MRLARLTLMGAALAASVACGSNFEEKNQVQSVRILAARADLPYARPGETVHIEALFDDPKPRPEPMRLFWFPVPCVDPPANLYYACYPAFESLFPIGVDLTSTLHEGKDITIKIPENALANAVIRPGQQTTEKSATAFVFMIACAGHVERIPFPGGVEPNALPVGCFSKDRRQLDADNFVFGFTRVSVFENRRNALPVLEGVRFQDRTLAPNETITIPRCVPKKDGKCDKVTFDSLFNDASAEPDVDNVDADGNVGRETLYVDWFASTGKFEDNRRIVFDPYRGRPNKTSIEYEPATEPIPGKIWAVLHDNRGGTAWLEFPIRVE